MTSTKIIQEIADKKIEKEKIAEKVIKKPEWLSEIFDGLSADKADIKYGCDKVLRIVSEKDPSLLYPKIDFFANNLENDNNFFKWGAIHIIANLAAVDSQNKIQNTRSATRKKAEAFLKKHIISGSLK